MAGKFYARFHVKHEDKSDSYLRKAYTNLDLHTDGTYVKDVTDWLMMTKIEEKNVEGGESVMLHLDDWEFLKNYLMILQEEKTLFGAHPKVKMLIIKLNTQFLKKTTMVFLKSLI
jgi:protein CsiD